MIGSALIWIPAGIFKLSEGATWQGVAILIYGVVVIGMVDNVFDYCFRKSLLISIH
ncbi:MAG: hypothetical protein IPL24_00920 [Bacteroidetes bacterium]|nr:hypothetical protein [Bacteroidota bacterium]